ncbi:unnamed protein product, partial [Ixodes persulcatus]
LAGGWLLHVLDVHRCEVGDDFGRLAHLPVAFRPVRRGAVDEPGVEEHGVPGLSIQGQGFAQLRRIADHTLQGSTRGPGAYVIYAVYQRGSLVGPRDHDQGPVAGAVERSPDRHHPVFVGEGERQEVGVLALSKISIDTVRPRLTGGIGWHADKHGGQREESGSAELLDPVQDLGQVAIVREHGVHGVGGLLLGLATEALPLGQTDVHAARLRQERRRHEPRNHHESLVVVLALLFGGQQLPIAGGGLVFVILHGTNKLGTYLLAECVHPEVGVDTPGKVGLDEIAQLPGLVAHLVKFLDTVVTTK